MRPGRNKFHAVKTGGYDSAREARRGRELELMERAGQIKDLQRQVRYRLIPEQREPDGVGPRGGVIRGKLLERPVDYIADFVYSLPGGETVVEDAKGVKTPDYVIKRKLMLMVYHIRVREV